MEVTASRACGAAESDCGALQEHLQMAAFWGPPSEDQIVGRLRNMVRRCPQYYPAVLELGPCLLRCKTPKGVEPMLGRGVRLMIDHIGEALRLEQLRVKAQWAAAEERTQINNECEICGAIVRAKLGIGITASAEDPDAVLDTQRAEAGTAACQIGTGAIAHPDFSD